MFGFGISNRRLKEIETLVKGAAFDEVARRNISYKLQELDREIGRGMPISRLETDCRNLESLIKKGDKNAALFLVQQMLASQEAFNRSRSKAA